MRPELRFFLALTLMIGVFVLTEVLFPPIRPEAPPLQEEAVESVEPTTPEVVTPPEPPGQAPTVEEPEQEVAERLVTVETPLYRMTFSSYGGAARSIRLLGYESFTREGAVELVPEGQEILGDPLHILTGFVHRGRRGKSAGDRKGFPVRGSWTGSRGQRAARGR